MNIKHFALALMATTMVALSACKKKGCTDPGAQNYNPKATKYDGSCLYSDFSRQTMLQHIADNIIIPSYNELKNKCEELETKVNMFTTTPNTTNLSALQTAWKNAYLAWQACSPFEFGPGEDEGIRTSLNTFPVDTAAIDNNISTGNYDLNSFTTTGEKGLASMDYLLYGLGENNDSVVAKYSTDGLAEQRITYLEDVATHILGTVETVYTAWIETGGNYVETFVEANGTDAGSSLGLMVNQLNFDYELIKNAKIGIPLGKKTLGQPLPDQVEAYYAGFSVELAIANIKAIELLYLGADGLGLDDHLNAVDAKYNETTLDNAIQEQLSKAISSLNLVADPLSNTIVSNPSTVEAAYDEIEAQVVLFKTDMPSALGVLITYQDNDGD